MAPIYNPAASASATDADTQYFTDLGLLSGLSKIVSATGGNTFPTPDDSYTSGTAAAVSDNILQWGAASADSWEGYDLGGTMTRVLSFVYVYGSTAGYQYLIHNKAALDDTDAYVGPDYYSGINSPPTPRSYLYKRVSTTFTNLAEDATIYSGTTPATVPSNPVYAMALYTSYVGGAGVQRLFMKMGSISNWIPVFSLTDTDVQEFKSIALWSRAGNQRCTTPFAVWGA